VQLLAGALSLALYLPVLFWHKVGVALGGVMLNRALTASNAPPHLRVSARRLLLHDWAKLTLAELMPYARRWRDNNLRATLFGRVVARTPLPRWLPDACDDVEWRAAWRHHYRHSDHHREYFGDDGGHRGAVMSDGAVLEMAADWLGAEWGYDGRWPAAGAWRDYTSALHTMWWPSPRNRAVFILAMCVLGHGQDVPRATFDELCALRELTASERAFMSAMREKYHTGEVTAAD